MPQLPKGGECMCKPCTAVAGCMHIHAGTPVAEQHLIFGAKQLESSMTVKQAGISVQSATVHFVMRLRGG